MIQQPENINWQPENIFWQPENIKPTYGKPLPKEVPATEKYKIPPQKLDPATRKHKPATRKYTL